MDVERAKTSELSLKNICERQVKTILAKYTQVNNLDRLAHVMPARCVISESPPLNIDISLLRKVQMYSDLYSPLSLGHCTSEHTLESFSPSLDPS